MSDTKIENAIIQAIDIIAKKRVAQAGFDRTIKGVVNKVLDSTIGKYQIRYQDSLFQAYATSAKVSYKEKQQVIILIPGNDWDRVKVILNGTQHWSTTYDSIPIVDDEFNIIGNNLITLNEEIGLSSYVNDDNVVLTEKINIKQLSDYIKQGNSIIFGMKVQTKLASSQVGGKYGLRFYCTFENDVTGQQEIRVFEVDSSDAMGNPYGLISPQWVKNSYPNIDTQNFVKINGIIAWVSDFPQDESKADIKDILISEISVNGANILTEEELNGYSLHIDSTESGLIIDAQTAAVPLTAQLKVKGVVMPQSDKLNFYWFRENGTVFRGDPRYFGYGGDGWECLNVKQDNVFVALHTGKYIFNTEEDVPGTSANMPNRVNKIKCVVIYDNRPYSKQIEVVNSNIQTNLIISSTDKQLGKEGKAENQTIYYLGNGLPTFTCLQINENGEEQDLVDSDEYTYTYTWSVTPYRGNTVQKPEKKKEEQEESENDFLKRVYEAYKKAKEDQEDKADSMDDQSRERYIKTTDYTTAISDWESVKGKQYIDGNKYINFPISSIITSSTIRCAVTKNDVYIGTASIILYNKMQLEGMYSLNLEYGTQVFQYDGKGNSPASPQLEKPLEIHPLTFTLLDNQGKQITHENIRRNGYIKWIIPKEQHTLLKANVEGRDPEAYDLTINNADLPLAASEYQVYSSLDSFTYTIANTYDKKKDINYIWLNVKYKDMVFDAYTNFTFPKDGDPGTNGTDYVVKLVPATNIDNKLIDSDSERIYYNNLPNSSFFGDGGEKIDNLKFKLYNNSREIENVQPSFWSSPPRTFEEDSPKSISYFNGSGELGLKASVDLTKIKEDKPVNIIRATYKGDKDIRYYAQFPICCNYTYVRKDENNKNIYYRIKVKPKTGFSYVVYSEDGTRPDYDNTLPFEIIVEQYKQLYENQWYYQKVNKVLFYNWQVIGNLKIDKKEDNKAYISPEDSFDGYDLSSAVVCSVYAKGELVKDEWQYEDPIGFIHIPIYMILNRYGHTALNGWDGNSIQLGEDKNKNPTGVVLAPQVGAGKKQDDNSFTGVLIGNQKTFKPDKDVDQTGLFGYHHGVRSIFLDSQTGKAEFGKQGAAKIILDPSQKINYGTELEPNEKDVAFLYSNSFNEKLYKDNKAQSKKDNTYGSGMMIDLTSPAIQFGSGHFYVNSDGDIHAGGNGQIAGWSIDDTKIYKHTNNYVTGMKSGEDPAFYAGNSNQDSNNPNSNSVYNFFVDHNGYLFGKSGQIAGWNFDNQKLYKDAVGMNSDPANNDYKLSSWPDEKNHDAKAFFANGNKFYVTHDGYLRSTSGKIAAWDIDAEQLTNGTVGLGHRSFTVQKIDAAFGSGTATENVNARFWGLENTDLNYVVDDKGKLYSKAGKIGGWNIQKNQLWAVNNAEGNAGIRLNSSGSITGGTNTDPGEGNKFGRWSISQYGDAIFNSLTANKSGSIAGWNIGETTLTSGSPTKGIQIASNGSIKQRNGDWEITNTGDGYFKNLYGKVKSGQTLSANGFTAGGGSETTLMDADKVYAKGTGFGKDSQENPTTHNYNKPLTDFITDLIVDNLITDTGSSNIFVSQTINAASFAVGTGISAAAKYYDNNGRAHVQWNGVTTINFSVGPEGNITTVGGLQGKTYEIDFSDNTKIKTTNGLVTWAGKNKTQFSQTKGIKFEDGSAIQSNNGLITFAIGGTGAGTTDNFNDQGDGPPEEIEPEPGE